MNATRAALPEDGPDSVGRTFIDPASVPFGDPTIKPGTIVQTAYVVSDVEAAVMNWADVTGAGPFFLTEIASPATVFRGAATSLRVRCAIGFLGTMNIELVQPLDNAPNIYAEALAERGPGLHHLNLHTNDVEADVARYQAQGLSLISRTILPGVGTAAFIDTREILGYYIELTSFIEPINRTVTTFRDAHRVWDGRDPIRRYPMIAGLNA